MEPDETKDPYEGSKNAAYAADFYYGHCTKCDAVWHPEEDSVHVCKAPTETPQGSNA